MGIGIVVCLWTGRHLKEKEAQLGCTAGDIRRMKQGRETQFRVICGYTRDGRGY